jgi:NhaP-type Na+/H+ or K+/H+ antiporter
MPSSYWILLAGVLFIAMMLGGTLLARLPLSGAMIYLALGYLLGPGVTGLIAPDPILHAGTLELVTEAALLISLFSVGLKLELPLLDRRWRGPFRLAFGAMAFTVAFIAALGIYGLGLPVGAAMLLGAILAPTDPVLASAIHSEPGPAPDPTRFSLAGEGALNDGTAFPFVLLGLGIMQLHDLGDAAWRWWVVDLLWSTAGGMLIGAAVGGVLGKLVIFLRTRHQSAIGLDEFLSLGVIAVSFSIAQLALASGFLSVFFAGLALRRTRDFPIAGTAPITPPVEHDAAPGAAATHSHHASGAMTRAVLNFNEQLERLAELGIVLMIGAMLPSVETFSGLWWLIPAIFLVVRPASVLLAFAGCHMPTHQLVALSWLGIRGIGSIYYLMFAIRRGVDEALAQQLVACTLAVVTASIIGHGITVLPLLRWYASRHCGGAR